MEKFRLTVGASVLQTDKLLYVLQRSEMYTIHFGSRVERDGLQPLKLIVLDTAETPHEQRRLPALKTRNKFWSNDDMLSPVKRPIHSLEN